MLNETYSDILDRNLKNQGKPALDSAIEALKWAACSGRPLGKEILLTAVQSNTTDEVTSENLLTWCRNLLDIDPSGMARFTHSSVREYVESIFTMKEAHTMAAQVCLDYIPHLQAKCAGFGLYACLYWPFHCDQASLSTGWKST